MSRRWSRLALVTLVGLLGGAARRGPRPGAGARAHRDPRGPSGKTA